MNDGFLNEDLLCNYINDNIFLTCNENMQNFLSFLFGENLSKTLPFRAFKIKDREKPDICIQHNGKQKYISLKKGSGNSVHQEKIDVFFPYIEKTIGVEQLNNLKLFHYGDDTIDNTGCVRYSASECRIKYANVITSFNNVVNQWSILEKMLDRFIFVGNIGSSFVDAIYHGSIDEGIWASRDEIKKYIRSCFFSIKGVHFGPLTYQVWGRDEKRTAKHPERRYVIQIKWGSIVKDLEFIRKKSNE